MVTRPIKEGILIALTALFAVLLCASFIVVTHHVPFDGLGTIAVVFLAVCWVVAQTLTLGLVQTPWAAYVNMSIAVVAVVLIGSLNTSVLIGTANAGAWGGALLLLLTLLIARSFLATDRVRFVEPRSRQVFGRGVHMIVLGLLLSLAGLAFPLVSERVSQDGIKVPEEYVTTVLRPLEPALQGIFPGFSSTTTIDDAIEQQLKQLPSDLVVTEAERSQLRQELSRQLGEQLSGRESFGSLVAKKINSFLRTATQTNALTVALVVIVLGVLTLRAAVPLVALALVFCVAGVVRALRVLGWFTIEKSTITVERLQL